MTRPTGIAVSAAALFSLSCASVAPAPETGRMETAAVPADYYGTLEPFIDNAVYFVVTDRFVDGDSANNHPAQGGGAETGTFDRPIRLAGKQPANIGYLGGDFAGLLANADYITEMGFDAVWITPIVENPDEAFTGGLSPGEGGFTDRGKAGYHGYWGVNFYELDEHLVSSELDFANFTRRMREAGLAVVLDIVCNHGSPAFTMPVDQPMFGEIYDEDGHLLADHQNLHPTELDPANPLHALFNREPDLAELADMNEDNPAVLDYFVGAYLQWLDQGAAAFRVDTIRHMPHAYWKAFSDRIRAEYPDLFMFAESFSYDADDIAEHTWPENGGISVLDFPGQQSMNAVFADGQPYRDLLDYLHLESRTYQNPYELMTFYDNHDMARMNADATGFIDAHNWMFTSRGAPVIYYGSEAGFRAGAREHEGNRDYFGAENIDRARSSAIRRSLIPIANARRENVALRRGLQVNLAFDEDTAAFYRVYRRDGEAQTALVLLNKGSDPARFQVADWLGDVAWRDALDGGSVDAISSPVLTVPAHGVRMLTLDDVPAGDALAARLKRLQQTAKR